GRRLRVRNGRAGGRLEKIIGLRRRNPRDEYGCKREHQCSSSYYCCSHSKPTGYAPRGATLPTHSPTTLRKIYGAGAINYFRFVSFPQRRAELGAWPGELTPEADLFRKVRFPGGRFQGRRALALRGGRAMALGKPHGSRMASTYQQDQSSRASFP